MDEGAKWQLVATVVLVAVAVFGAVRLLDRGGAGASAEPVRVSGGDADRSVGRRDRGPLVVVHVAGAVARPGVYRLSDGARVAAAVARAGGPARRADLTAVNLAAPLADGQQVIVPRRVGAPGSTAVGTEGPPSLASATAEELEELDGIGEAIAARIVEYRQSHGGFRSLDELAEVDGIGEKRLEALKDALRP